ncbi:MAG: hypothetical protein RL699_1647 [Bacteroidota bacterium]|jgi:hypothetical protein
MKWAWLALVCVVLTWPTCAQQRLNSFLTPADSLQISRRTTVLVSETALSATALVGLSQLWYADYPKSNFHFIDDSNEWMQLDKAGHLYSSYHLGRFSAEALAWSGVSKKNQLLYSATYGFAFLTAVEVLDGYSAQWGASWTDVAANAAGTALYVSQELWWNEQRIVPKYSFHTTSYAQQRPDLLGSSLQEQLLKDYNGQTYWLSVNLQSFIKTKSIPAWVNIAMGYGAEGMVSANELTPISSVSPTARTRQFYLSLDVDLTRIKTKSHLVKTICSVFNTIKIPAPTIEFGASGAVQFHPVYF